MIRIIDYKAGNAPSVLHAVEHLGYNAAFAHNKEELADASCIILPGVGSAKATMESLSQMGFLNTLEDLVIRKKIIFLGICVGLQILFEHSEEGNTDCLGWLKGRVVKFDAAKVRVPQMGWNLVNFDKTGFSFPVQNEYFYFVNSYYAQPANKADIWGTAEYNGTFAAAVCKENIFAAQFHIEKSGKAGLSLLNSILEINKGELKC